jgi:hypothetical protein
MSLQTFGRDANRVRLEPRRRLRHLQLQCHEEAKREGQEGIYPIDEKLDELFQEEAFKFLEWFVKDETQKKWAELGGYTCSAAVLQSDEFRKATPFNEAFYQTMFMVKDFWAVPEYAELLTAINNRAYPFIVGGEGTAKDVLDATAADWNATFKKYGYVK